jgi:proteasome accessory factor B
MADQAERLKWLDKEISKGKHPNASALAEKFEISLATAYRDIDYLKYILRAPLNYDYGTEGYTYTAKFKLPAIKPTEGELAALLVIGQLRKSYEGTGLESVCQQAADLLSSKLKEHETVDTSSLDQILQVEIDPFPQIDLGVFQDLLRAISNNESIVIKYFSGQKAVVVDKPCDPYHLLNFKDNWYLVAFCHEKQDFRDFLCSRILHVENTNVTFLPDPDFSLATHKRESQLFAAEAPQVEIVAEFDKYAAHWIRLKTVHPTQEVTERSDGSLEVRFQVSSMENIMRWILSFGEHARILAPQDLQERVRRAVGRMNYLYNRF